MEQKVVMYHIKLCFDNYMHLCIQEIMNKSVLFNSNYNKYSKQNKL